MIDLAALSYAKSDHDDLWLPIGSRPAFGYCDGPEEEDVRQAIAGAKDRSLFSAELTARITGWVTRYHLSPARSGLLRPVMRLIRGEVLEIGAGFGAITRGLGEAGASVTAFEGGRFRAAAAALRCRDLPNVQVACDDVANLPAAARFDTIVMIGVLEYARMFGMRDADGAGDPADRMLARIAALLRPGGRLVLAIENQLGLKYFAGCAEDHLNEPFAGIEDRYAADGPCTFGRRELAGRLDRAGFGEQRWLYPFPDYKLPSVILTDRAAGADDGFDAASLIGQAVRRDAQRPATPLFSMGAAWRAIARNGLAPDLAHSFLVVASAAPVPDSDTLAYYLALDRPAPHGKAVRFVRTTEGGIVAETEAADGAAMRADPYQAGSVWHDELAALTLRPGWRFETLSDWAATWWAAVLAALRQAGVVSGEPAANTPLPSRFMDAIPRNLIVDARGAHFIDLEWSLPSEIEAGYLFHRGLHNSFLTLEACAAPETGAPTGIDEIVMRLAFGSGLWMTQSDIVRYRDFERQFQAHVAGATPDAAPIAFGNERIPLRLSFAEIQRLDATLAEHRRHAANLEAKAGAVEASVAEHARHAAALEAALDAARREGGDTAGRLEAELAEHRRHAANLEAKADAAQADAAGHARHAATLEAALDAARREAAMRSEQLARQTSTLEEAIGAQARQAQTQQETTGRLHELIDLHRQQGEDAAARAREAGAEAERLRDRLRAMRASASWRAMAPCRAAFRSLRRLASGAPGPQTPRDPASDAAANPDASLPAPADPARDARARLVADSGLFDVSHYAGADAARTAGLEPIDHYLTIGEAQGLRPSPGFDPAFYRKRHPDIAASGISPLLHYLEAGRHEGRLPLPAAATLACPTDGLRPDRRTVLVLIHEATRTGASILGWNIAAGLRRRHNVVTLLKRGGPIEAAIAEISDAAIVLPDDFMFDDEEIGILANRLASRYAPLYAIANSAETRYFVPALEREGVPAVSLIHEFSASIRPLDAMYPLFGSASKIVFSTRLTANSFLADYVTLVAREYEVLPQGASRLPAKPAPEPPEATAGTALDAAGDVAGDAAAGLARLPGRDTFLVVGVGTITLRKGVDFFIAAAAAALRRAGDTKLAFAWVGQAYKFDQFYVDFLEEQVRRSGIEASFHFLGEFEDLEPVYARADALLMSSRLDPLPNVGIDAIMRGIPVVCFAEASGIAELLQDSEALRELVVPHLDAGAAADAILRLARGPDRVAALAESLRAFGQRHFDMARYVAKLDELGRDAAAAARRRARDRDLILSHGGFNRGLYFGGRCLELTEEQAVERYLHVSRLAAPRGRPLTGRLLRRPLEGFNPLVYAGDNPGYDESSGEDPLAHYLRADRPQGRWSHVVIRPSLETGTRDAPRIGRIAVHGHFHYPELIDDFLLRLRANHAEFDLLLTTNDEASARFLRDRAGAMGREASVAVAPNRGRDIGPLLTGETAERLAGYDLVGHFHGKRSVHIDAVIGQDWRNFLWEHLIGAKYPMVDAIVAAFAADPQLGLVFPEDPHLNDWDRNRDFAEAFAARMGLTLPNHFDFPQGTMFWARAAALRPLRDLGLGWEDYMAEPLPIDGTALHALERLVPFSAEAAGFRFATTHVPEFAR